MRSRRLPWVIVGVLAGLVAVLVVLLLLRDDGPGDDTPGTAATEAGSATPTDPASVAPADDDDPTAPATPEESGPPVTMPLRDPGDHLPADGVSAIPAVGTDLADEDYFVHLAGVDVAARTVEVDVEVFYMGSAAVDYLLAHDPTAEIPPPNDYTIANESTSLRTLPLAADVRIWDWCNDTDGLGFAERSLAEWAAAPAGGEMACDAGPALSHGWNEVYWLQVRGGEVKRVIGQYLP